jgi:hypothetical protein
MADVVDRLAAAPAVVNEVVGRAVDPTRRPAPDEWSVAEIVGHLLAADAIWTPRILVALVHDGITMPGVDERALQEVLDGAGIQLGSRVALFAAGRAQLVGVLRAASSAQWGHTCLHTQQGVMTVHELCDGLAVHEEEHLEQLRRQ